MSTSAQEILLKEKKRYTEALQVEYKRPLEFKEYRISTFHLGLQNNNLILVILIFIAIVFLFSN